VADNFVTNPGSGGATFASDECVIGGNTVQVPRLKTCVGADGTAQDNWTPYGLKSAASTNLTVVKNAPGAIGFILAQNLNAAIRYLKLYNKASAPVLATDAPLLTIPIPANTTGAGFAIAIPGGLGFSAGIALALTTGVADNDTGAVAANEVFLSLGFA
jgi:hypothetical protein